MILFDNAGVGGSTNTVPRTATTIAPDALRFIDALELRDIDVLGFSLGGFVGQELVLIRPRLVRRIVLAGTGPQGGEDVHASRTRCSFTRPRPRPASCRGHPGAVLRAEPDQPRQGPGVPEAVFTAPTTATPAPHWRCATGRDQHTGTPDASSLNPLAGITQPVLVANRDCQRMVPTKNSYLLGERPIEDLPGCRAGFPFQYQTEFAGEVERFLNDAQWE